MGFFNFCSCCFNNCVAVDIQALIFWWPKYGEHDTISSDEAGEQVGVPLISEHSLTVDSALLVTVHNSRRKCTIV